PANDPPAPSEVPDPPTGPPGPPPTLADPFQTLTPALAAAEPPGYLAVIKIEDGAQTRQLPALVVKKSGDRAYLVARLAGDTAPLFLGDREGPLVPPKAKFTARFGETSTPAAFVGVLPMTERLVFSVPASAAPEPAKVVALPKVALDEVVRVHGWASDG